MTESGEGDHNWWISVDDAREKFMATRFRARFPANLPVRCKVYLDEDLLVVRDETGAPEVLLRRAMEFPEPDAGTPSAADDDLAPGAG